jgi:hypothetical protein
MARLSGILTFLLSLGAVIVIPGLLHASGLQEITEILSHPEQYDRQEVMVTGQVTNIQLATNREGQPAYGFLLKSQAGTLKVISLGQVDVREGDQVIIYNEIKALSIKPLNRLTPDLVG